MLIEKRRLLQEGEINAKDGATRVQATSVRDRVGFSTILKQSWVNILTEVARRARHALYVVGAKAAESHSH